MPSEEPTPKAETTNKKRILIVEDERPLAHALELKFQHEGYETKTCTNGTEAMVEAKTGNYAIILLDLIMPEMDGFTFLSQVDTKKIPIIVLTNLGQEEDRNKAKELGAKDYFVKSTTPIAQIVSIVKSLV